MRLCIPLLLLTLLATVLVGCNRHAPPPADNKPAPAVSKQKNKPVFSNSESSSSESSSESDESPAQISETESIPEASESSSASSLVLKSLQLPPTAPSAWKEGVHYRRFSPVQPTSSIPGQIEVTSVFWYGSAHCYVLDQSLEVWRKQKANYINYVRLPIMWGGVQRLHARMFYIAELLGKTEELNSAIYQELHVRKAPLNTLEHVRNFFVAHGISLEDFNRANASPSIDASLRHAQIMGDRFRVNSVPLVVINGRYYTDVAMAGGQAQLLVLINELAAREKGM